MLTELVNHLKANSARVVRQPESSIDAKDSASAATAQDPVFVAQEVLRLNESDDHEGTPATT